MIIYKKQEKLPYPQKVNENFNNIMYSVLMNRMENDLTGQEQIDETLVSDNFNCVCGWYETVCVVDTTGIYDCNFYINKYHDYDINLIYSCNPFQEPITCLGCGYQYIKCNVLTNNYLLSCVEIRGRFCGTHCAYGTICSTNYINLKNYNLVEINSSITHCWRLYDANANFTTCNCGCVMIYNDEINLENTYYFIRYCTNCTAEVNYNCVIKFVFKRINNNCYAYYLNNIFICNIQNLCVYIKNTANSYLRQHESVFSDGVCQYLANNVCIVGMTAINSTVNTNLKTYSTPKNKTILVANAYIPAGNSITYDIYNLSNTKLLENAEPNKIYSLSSNTDCCFYAVIKQNVECNLCEPQKLYGYALKFF